MLRNKEKTAGYQEGRDTRNGSERYLFSKKLPLTAVPGIPQFWVTRLTLLLKNFLAVFLISALCSLICPTICPIHAATLTAVTCSQADVQARINSAQDGDTVMVPAGNCTWNAAVTIQSKTITLQGAGSGSGGTHISYGGTNHPLLDIDAGSKTGKMDISGFWLSGGDPDYWSGTAMQLYGPAGWKNVRVHHMVFDGNKQWSIKLGAATYGVMDHCTFKGSAYGIMTYGRSATDWATPLTLGTADFFFFEDNTFDWNDFYGVTGVPVVDMDSGGRTVFRNNTVRYGMWETHDKARSGLVSAHAYEIYNNTFWTNTQKWKGLDISAGTGVVWGNTFTGPHNYAIGGMDYKSFDPRGVRLCDGTDPADQNTPGQSGWRCQYQIGSHGEGPSAVGYPLYLWNNTLNGSSVGMVVTDGANHVQANRDYYNNGSTPKPGYAPYTYPHPLVGGSAASPCDINTDNSTNVNDVQLCANQAIGVSTCTADINKDGACNVIDVQRVVNAALGGQCVTQ